MALSCQPNGEVARGGGVQMRGGRVLFDVATRHAQISAGGGQIGCGENPNRSRGQDQRLGDLKLLVAVLLPLFGEVAKARKFGRKAELDRANRAVTLFANDDFSLTEQAAHFVLPRGHGL